jgi:hypothetical protein
MTRRPKYGAVSTVVDGIRFASKREAKRFAELKLLEKAGEIVNLKRQVRYKLQMETVYVADFTYSWKHGGGEVVEDSKGYATREFKRKAKLMKQQHNVDVRCV